MASSPQVPAAPLEIADTSSAPAQNFLGGITSPLGALIAPSPASALNEIKQRAALYGETKDEAHLKQIRSVLQYVKVYQRITAGMNKKEKRRAVMNPKWLDDVPSLGIYEFVYSDKELTLEDAQRVRHDIIAAWGEKTPVTYPQLTAEHIKTLKHALLLSGQYLDIEWHRVFLVLGTYYLDNRADHPIYKPVSPAKAKSVKAASSGDAAIGCALPPVIATARAMTGNPNFGGATAMQKAILQAAHAQSHPVTQTDAFKKATLLMQCYMAQGAGITADTTASPPKPGSAYPSSSAPPANPAGNATTASTSTAEEKQRQMQEDAILKKLATDVLKTASISSFESSSTLADIVDKGAEVIEAGMNKLEMGIDRSKEKLRRVLSAKKSGLTRVQEIQKAEGYTPRMGPLGGGSMATLSSENSGVEGGGGSGDEFAVREPEARSNLTGSSEEEFPMRESCLPLATSHRGVQLHDDYVPDNSSGDGAGSKTFPSHQSSEVHEPSDAHDFNSSSMHPSHDTKPSGTPTDHSIQEPIQGPLDPTSSSSSSANHPSPNMTLDSILESIALENDGSGGSGGSGAGDESFPPGSGPGRDPRHRSLMKKAKDLVGQSDKSKMREQRRERRAQFEIEE